ncbi:MULTISPECIES: energy transducer TonB [Vibrio]|uniref:energy transducer TonB n=1 Tax=Vibrio TaxID=662 RepID=UPI0005AF3E0E|nr:MULTISPECIES: energy transducer TonB [Vibrio]KIP76467.1 energy transducer TonB [Vibrio harveyi]
MSALAGPSFRHSHRKKRFVFTAILLSASLHTLIAIAYMWTPEYDFSSPPQAIPITVSIVAPMAAPQNTIKAVESTEQQEELVQQARQEQPVKQEPKQEQSPALIESKQPSTIAAKPEKPIKTEKPKPDRTKPEPEIKKLSKEKRPEINQAASSKPSLETKRESKQISALRQGQQSEAGRAAKVSWQQALHAHLEREKRYPRQARRLKKKGMPVIRFTMDREGSVLDVELVKSSGTASLDREAIELVGRAQPLVKPPSSVKGARLTLTLPINFSF